MTAFVNGRIFDGEQAKLIEGLSVYVKDGKITEMSDRPANPDDGDVIDCGGRTVMPGLIDAHIHAKAFTADAHEADTAPESLLASWAGYMLGRMLDRGFTTVRDAGGADFGIALALERGYMRGPRLYYCGYGICQTGGGFDARNPHARSLHGDHSLACACSHLNNVAIVVDGVDKIRQAVRENIRRGASFIKFVASGDVTTTGSRLHSIEFSDEEVLAIVDEVNRHGIYCTAHAHSDPAIRRAIRLGVHCIEHGTMIEPETARMAADAGTYVVPTLAVVAAFAARGPEAGLHPVSMAKLEQARHKMFQGLAHMRNAGIRLGFGTDLLGFLEAEQCSEFPLRRQVFTSHEILVQATSMNAEVIGAKGKLGVVKPGAHADLLVVDGDPLADIDVLAQDGRTLDLIMLRGEIVKNRITGQSTLG